MHLFLKRPGGSRRVVPYLRMAAIYWAAAAVLISLQACAKKPVFALTSYSTLANLPAGLANPAVSRSCGSTYLPGHVAAHRLTNEEYNNTVRDLLHTSLRPGDSFPADIPGASGFASDSVQLDIGSVWFSNYYSAAETLAKEVISSKGRAGGAYLALVTCGSAGAVSTACMRSSVEKLASRAYRRPLSPVEVLQIDGVYASAPDPDTGLRDSIVAILMNPKFLFLLLDNPNGTDPNAVYNLSDYELASRLSYFLWSSMPDEPLLAAAASGSLAGTSNGLGVQALRMLKDPKALALARMLRRDWAQISELEDNTVTNFDAQTKQDMITEARLFFEDLVQNDKSLMTALTARYSFMNANLAALYGLPATSGNASTFMKTNFADQNRMGIQTFVSVLASTAGGSGGVTHPVIRGLWSSTAMTCLKPGMRPANVPPSPKLMPGQTPRQVLAVHTASTSCSSCHDILDPVGLGLENFDLKGSWRDTYTGNVPIDPSGKLSTGQVFNNVPEMLATLANSPSTQNCVASKLMQLALTRSLNSSADHCVNNALASMEMNPSRPLSAHILEIINTLQFRRQMGEAPQ